MPGPPCGDGAGDRVKLTFVYRDREYLLETTDDQVRVDGALYDVRQRRDGAVRVSAAEQTTDPTSSETSGGTLERDGRIAWVAAAGAVRWVFINGDVYELSEPGPKNRRRGAAHESTLMAPMPATVRSIAVTIGDRVKPGDTLIVLEAMKMELPVRAAAAGTIRTINCREGELVQPGVALIAMETEA